MWVQFELIDISITTTGGYAVRLKKDKKLD